MAATLVKGVRTGYRGPDARGHGEREAAHGREQAADGVYDTIFVRPTSTPLRSAAS